MTQEFKQEIELALKALKNGQTILYPTDTIWGLGCDATNEEAVNKIHKIKGSATSKSMLVLIDSANMLYSYIDQVPEIAFQLIEVTVEPLTIIYPGGKNLAKNLLSDDGSIGIRIASDEFCQELIRQFRKPIVSTSANLFSKSSPANFRQIEDVIIESVDHIVQLRQNETYKNKPSGIIKIGINNEIQVIRK